LLRIRLNVHDGARRRFPRLPDSQANEYAAVPSRLRFRRNTTIDHLQGAAFDDIVRCTRRIDYFYVHASTRFVKPDAPEEWKRSLCG
jgi:hypothetical protein